MFCHKCGAENDGGSVYCRACGENISPEDASLLESAAAPAGEEKLLVPLPDDPSETLSPVDLPSPPPPAPAASAQKDPRPMKFLTRVAYNILESDRKSVAFFLLALFTGLAAIAAVASCLGLVSAFADLGNARAALPSGIQSESLQLAIDRAWRSIWGCLALIPVSFLVFFSGVRLFVRIRRVAETLKKIRKEFD